MTAKIYFIFYSSGFFDYLQYLLYFMLSALESICILRRMKVCFAFAGFVREMTPCHHCILGFVFDGLVWNVICISFVFFVFIVFS